MADFLEDRMRLFRFYICCYVINVCLLHYVILILKLARSTQLNFIAVKENLTPLLGTKAIQQMKLIKVHEENFEKAAAETTTSATSMKAHTAQGIIEEYSDVFEGDRRTLEGLQHLNVDPSVPPSIAPSRRVPFAIKPRLKAELERLTDIGVLMPVDEPTELPLTDLITATKETGDLRLCLDPQQLNKALKRERDTPYL